MANNSRTIWEFIDSRVEVITSYTADCPEREGFEVERTVGERFRQVMQMVCEDSSVFPIVAPGGEHDVCAVWHAGEYMLHICIAEGEEVISTRRPGVPLEVFWLDEARLAEIRNHLRALSDRVKEVNPEWRQLIDS
jgi:hypothetical protein